MRDYHDKKSYKKESKSGLVLLALLVVGFFLWALLDWWFKVPS